MATTAVYSEVLSRARTGLARGAACGCRHSLRLPLHTGAALGADKRAVARPRRDGETVAGMERDPPAIREQELDGPANAVQYLPVGVLVLAVAIARSVRPAMDAARLAAEAALQLCGGRRFAGARRVLHAHWAKISP